MNDEPNKASTDDVLEELCKLRDSDLAEFAARAAMMADEIAALRLRVAKLETRLNRWFIFF